MMRTCVSGQAAMGAERQCDNENDEECSYE